jgi:tRNA threonylcarbamoyladenosine biosynthesis protein TsaB
MNLLAIDSFGQILSVAAAKGDDIFYTEIDAYMRQSELVMGLIDDQMKAANLLPANLDGVLSMGGPGSFTGLRIGYSIAKGLALSLSIPFTAIPTLDCITAGLRDKKELIDKTILAVIESRKSSYYYAFYKIPADNFTDIKPLTPYLDADSSLISGEIDRLKEEIILTGPGSVLLYDSLPEVIRKKVKMNYNNNGYAGELIYLAKIRKIPDNNSSEYLYSGPEYIRKSDAEAMLTQQ